MASSAYMRASRVHAHAMHTFGPKSCKRPAASGKNWTEIARLSGCASAILRAGCPAARGRGRAVGYDETIEDAGRAPRGGSAGRRAEPSPGDAPVQGLASSAGSTTFTHVPMPGSLSMWTVPPSASIRSQIEAKPMCPRATAAFKVDLSKPRPSSLTSISTPSGRAATRTATFAGAACSAAFASSSRQTVKISGSPGKRPVHPPER